MDSVMTDPCIERDSLLSPEDNRRMFDRIARPYDLLNRLLSFGLDRGWRREAAAMLGPRPGGRYLDVGCGTGSVGIEVLRQCPGAHVVGIDPAEEMLTVAREKVHRAGLAEAISLQVGDATALPFEGASFAGVIGAFSLRNIAYRARAVGEMRRVLSPGGRVVMLELTVPPGRIVRLGHRLYTRWVVPTAGRLIARSGDAYRYLVDSVADFPDAEAIRAMMDKLAFSDARYVRLTGGIVTLFLGTAT
ncbi:MAG TPA: ubiquinone/menaquinone biosynthesis methyltransferase [Phycisphaerae bacterium]|nr:ubiquinone/menaquinone biosynthesis methyltransferase [Phycisphaerae bacterium]